VKLTGWVVNGQSQIHVWAVTWLRISSHVTTYGQSRDSRMSSHEIQVWAVTWLRMSSHVTTYGQSRDYVWAVTWFTYGQSRDSRMDNHVTTYDCSVTHDCSLPTVCSAMTKTQQWHSVRPSSRWPSSRVNQIGKARRPHSRFLVQQSGPLVDYLSTLIQTTNKYNFLTYRFAKIESSPVYVTSRIKTAYLWGRKLVQAGRKCPKSVKVQCSRPFGLAAASVAAHAHCSNLLEKCFIEEQLR